MESTYLIARIRDALASEAGELAVQIEVRPGVVLLSGVVSTDEQRRRVEEIVRPMSAGYVLVNDVQVRPPRAPEEPEALP
jgi:hypothetical protein